MSYRPITPAAFLRLLLLDEAAAIIGSRDATVQAFWLVFTTAVACNAKIDLGSANVLAGLAYCSATNQNPAPATAWAEATAYAAGAICAVGSNVYVAATPGTSAASGAGPSGQGAGIADGTTGLTWNYQATPYLAAGREQQILNLFEP